MAVLDDELHRVGPGEVGGEGRRPGGCARQQRSAARRHGKERPRVAVRPYAAGWNGCEGHWLCDVGRIRSANERARCRNTVDDLRQSQRLARVVIGVAAVRGNDDVAARCEG